MIGGRVEEAASLIDLATAAVGQAGNSDELRGQLLNNIGVVHMLQDNYQQARQDWEDGLAVWQRALGPDHPDVLKAVINLGSAYSRLGKNLEAIYGPADAHVADAHLDLSKFFLARERMPEAWAEAERARQIAERSAPTELADALAALAEVRRTERRHAEAAQLLVQAVAVDARSPGDKTAASARLRSLAEVYAAAGELDLAIATYERALALWDNDPDGSGERGEIRFSFAKAIAAKDRTRATELAKTAREELASAQYADRRAEVEKWIAGR